MSSRLIVAALVGNLTFALFLLGRTVQRTERSRFRYTIWQIRDELVDHLREGGLKPEPAVERYIDRLHFMISATELLTPFRVVTGLRLLSRSDWDIPAEFLEPGPDHPVLNNARVRADQARRQLFLLGSPSGWLLLSVAPVVGLWVLVTERPEQQRPMDAATAWWRKRYGNSLEAVRPLVRRNEQDNCAPPAYV